MLALVTDAFGGRGGISEYNRNLLTALAGTGTLDRIVALPRYTIEQFALPDVSIEQLPPRRSRIGYAMASLWSALRLPVDIVFCGHLYMAPLAAFIARLKGAKLVVQMHGIETWRHPGYLQRTAVETADLVLCVSRHTRGAVLGWASLPFERVRVLPNTVGSAYSPGPPSARVLARYGLHGRKVLLTVSRISRPDRYKGHEAVLRALAKVSGSHPEVLYLIVGDGDHRPALEEMAARLGVGGVVRFTGHVPEDDIPDLYRASEVFVMPSTGEGFGIVFLEAAGCGLHVIAGNRDGSVDALADGALGTLVDPENEEGLVAALEAALDRVQADHGIGPQREELACAVQARFGRDIFAARARSVLERVMEAA